MSMVAVVIPRVFSVSYVWGRRSSWASSM